MRSAVLTVLNGPGWPCTHKPLLPHLSEHLAGVTDACYHTRKSQHCLLVTKTTSQPWAVVRVTRADVPGCLSPVGSPISLCLLHSGQQMAMTSDLPYLYLTPDDLLPGFGSDRLILGQVLPSEPFTKTRETSSTTW